MVLVLLAGVATVMGGVERIELLVKADAVLVAAAGLVNEAVVLVIEEDGDPGNGEV